LSRLRMLCAGVTAGELKKGRFLPAHGLAMAGMMRKLVSLPPEDARLAEYLGGQTMPTELADGWYAVAADKYPLGLAKAAGGVLKNHLPKGLRR